MLITHEYGTAVTRRPIPRGDSVMLRFWAPAETSFSCAIELPDEKTLPCRGGYAEAGYRFDLSVTDDGVDQQLHPFDGFVPHFGL